MSLSTKIKEGDTEKEAMVIKESVINAVKVGLIVDYNTFRFFYRNSALSRELIDVLLI